MNFSLMSLCIAADESLPEKSILNFLPARINDDLNSDLFINPLSTSNSIIDIAALTPSVDDIILDSDPLTNTNLPIPSVDSFNDLFIKLVKFLAEFSDPDAQTFPVIKV